MRRNVIPCLSDLYLLLLLDFVLAVGSYRYTRTLLCHVHWEGYATWLYMIMTIQFKTNCRFTSNILCTWFRPKSDISERGVGPGFSVFANKIIYLNSKIIKILQTSCSSKWTYLIEKGAKIHLV